MNKWIVVLLVGLVIFVVGAYVYFEYRTPPGVVAKSDTETLAWIGLASTVVGLLTSIFGLLNTLAKRNK